MTDSPERLADVEATIQEFVRDNLVEGFEGDDPLEELDLDSLALEQLIDFLEEKYRILLVGEDWARPNFATVPTAARMIEARRRITDLERQRWLKQPQRAD